MNELYQLLTDTWNFFKFNLIGICMVIMPFIIPIDIIYTALEFTYEEGNESTYWLASLAGMAIYPIYQGAMILYIASVITGEYLNPKQYYRLALRFWLPLMILYVISSVAMTLGLLLLIFPGLIVLSRISFAEFYCILHNKSGLDAFSESWKETEKDQWLLLKGIIALYIVITLPIVGAEYILETIEIWNPVFSFVSGVVSSLLAPLLTIFSFRVYMRAPERLNKTNNATP